MTMLDVVEDCVGRPDYVTMVLQEFDGTCPL